MSDVMLQVSRLHCTFGAGRVGEVRAVNDVTFSIHEGETFGLVGESGSGKTTTGRAMVGLLRPSSGAIRYQGREVQELIHGPGRSDFRSQVQMIFQDPHASLDPRMKVRDIVAEGIDIGKLADSKYDRRSRVEEALASVGLDPAFSGRYPHQFSGGQRQRIGIARALAVGPRLLVCDEPISALDASVQAQVVNLLATLKRERGLTYLFIAHDLAMVRHISDRIGVMYRGRLLEVGPAQEVYTDPLHPYTQSLLSAVPHADPDLERSRRRVEYEPDQAPGQLREQRPGRWVAE